MTKRLLSSDDRIGLLRPANDAHSLGIAAAAALLDDCGIASSIAGKEECEAAADLASDLSVRSIGSWIKMNGITALGFSYRLDPRAGVEALGRLIELLKRGGFLLELGGMVGNLYFAGLPEACALAAARFPRLSGTLSGGEATGEAMDALGIPRSRMPPVVSGSIAYDEARLKAGQRMIETGEYLKLGAIDRTGMKGFGTRSDGLIRRLEYGDMMDLPPLLRAHMGPYSADRREAVGLFLEWTRRLARGGMLDVLSIGTSQLTQERFGEDWGEAPNGGGVPINSPEEYESAKEAAFPMLVRTYAGSRGLRDLARMHEETLDIAWHAFSLWWFDALDGRGPYTLTENLHEQRLAVRYAAETGKPVEPNVSHHFAFRGGDDLSYVVSGYAAARFMRDAGVNHLVLQAMLNTPRGTYGVQDLAKARALLSLTEELEDGGFRVHLQPRAGLDYLSSDPGRAKVQLAAATMMMDDIRPLDSRSPGIIHVVSYSEGYGLADPETIEESAKITRFALGEYRRLKAEEGGIPGTWEAEAEARTRSLISGARNTIEAIEESVPDPWTVEGLYAIFAAGFLPVPDLWNCREEFPEAVRWRTRLVDGGVKVVDDGGLPVALEERLGQAKEAAFRAASGRSHERRGR